MVRRGACIVSWWNQTVDIEICVDQSISVITEAITTNQCSELWRKTPIK